MSKTSDYAVLFMWVNKVRGSSLSLENFNFCSITRCLWPAVCSKKKGARRLPFVI